MSWTWFDKETFALALSGMMLVGCSDNGASDAGTTDDLSDETTEGSSEPGDPATDSTSGGAGASDGADGGADSGTSGGGGEPVDPLVWTDSCVVDGFDFTSIDPRLECTTVEVPLDWDDPQGAQVEVFVSQVPSDADSRKGQFVMLDGGPGSDGVHFLQREGMVYQLNAAGFDVVVPHHRGTVSPQLRCEGGNLSRECRDECEAQWGAGLAHFGAAEAARDVGELIARTELGPGEKTVVYGHSYGTYLAQFYLAAHPNQADAVVLDSVLPAGGAVVDQPDLVEAVGEALLQECVDDPQCGARVPYGSGEEFAAAAVEAFNQGDCGGRDLGTWADSEYQAFLTQLVNSPLVRSYVPVMVALLAECTPETTSIVDGAIDVFTQGSGLVSPTQLDLLPQWGGNTGSFRSIPTFAAVTATSILAENDDTADAVARARDHLVTSSARNTLDNIQRNWGDLPNTDFSEPVISETPVLVVQARYDTQTPLPWAEEVAARYGTEVVVFEDGFHGILFEDGGQAVDGFLCGRDLILSFASSFGEVRSVDCLDELAQLDVNLEQESLRQSAEILFGTRDPWSLL